jgi:uncharacterized protein (DUF433 family)
MDIDFDQEEEMLLKRITRNPEIYGGKPIIRGHRLAVEHVLGMMVGGSTPQEIVEHYDWLEIDDVTACLLYALRVLEHEHDAATAAAPSAVAR